MLIGDTEKAWHGTKAPEPFLTKLVLVDWGFPLMTAVVGVVLLGWSGHIGELWPHLIVVFQ